MANATIDMNPVADDHGRSDAFAYEITQTLTAAGYTAAILIPKIIQSVAVTLVATTAATGKVQTTTDDLDTVKNGTVEWSDWALGTITTKGNATFFPITAIRAVMAGLSGTVKISVRAQ